MNIKNSKAAYIDKTSRAAQPKGNIKALIGGGLAIVLANLTLRLLELANFHRLGGSLFDYFTTVNSSEYIQSLLRSPWKFLLPVQISPDFMRWSTTGLLPISLSNHFIGVDATFLLLNSLLVICSLITSWLVFRSTVFTFTFTILMGIGSQFIHAYNNSSIIILLLFFIYLEINLCSLYFMLKKENRKRTPEVVFVLSLVLLVLCCEFWVDVLAFLFLVSTIILIYGKKRKDVFYTR
jgi:hypothetical protein